MSQDADLLRRYADEGAEDAFGELVRRNLDLVYATALRHLGDPHRAEDVAQLVFIDFARKARSLRAHPAPVSWLYTSTRFAALKLRRTEQRRQAREQEAHTMQEMLSPEPAPDWERLRPILDEVLHALGERDREIVLLRYFRGLPFADLARAMQLNEGAARMRVDRALDKMNGLLAQRGIHSTAGALGVALSGAFAVAAPAGLAASITGAALAGATAGTAVGVAGILFAMSKMKTILACSIVAGGVATAVVEVRANRVLRAELAALSRGDPTDGQRENRRLRAEVAKLGGQHPDLAELARLRMRSATLKARPDGVTDAGLRPPANVGRATPAAAGETFGWAVQHGDLDTLATFIGFTDDSPENRAAFLAQCSPAVRDRYRTAEAVCAAALFGAVFDRAADPERMEAMQVFSVEEDKWPGEVKMRAWLRLNTGREHETSDKYQLRGDGWGIRATSLSGPAILQLVRERLDPATGSYIGPRPNLSAPKP